MSQIEVPKLVEYVAVGPKDTEIAVPKLVMYVVAVPDSSTDTSNRQGHVHAQIIRRD